MSLARVICTAIVLSLLASPQAPVSDVSDAIRATVGSGRSPASESVTLAERGGLTALYEPGRFAPLWLDSAGHPNRDARNALDVLNGAAAEGLDPADYHAAALSSLAASLASISGQPSAHLAAFDTDLSANMLRLFRELHSGRVDPRAIGFRMNVPADEDDMAEILRTAITGHRIAEVATDLAPPLILYRALRVMLAQYRSLAANPALEMPPLTAAAVRPGQPYLGLGALYGWLVALGDLPPAVPAPSPPVYEGAMVEGVKRFQIRHGLDPDGVLGKSTQAALRVPLDWRVRQIELALERLRWLPHLGAERLVAVNIPMFRLWAWDSISPPGTPAFGTGVIVGRALNTQTPVFVEEMTSVIFRPYWNIPPSITRHEILPAIERIPGYLEREDMEIVSGPGDDARPVVLSPESLQKVREGRLRIRQRPGPKNALGLVKFVFPNDANVYMHGTPAPQLFTRTRRDFSHGCVRVEDPVALAEWVLKGQVEWTREAIVAAMNAEQPRRVTLERPIQVILFYITAVVMPEDATIRFAEDIYGHDARLERALSRRR